MFYESVMIVNFILICLLVYGYYKLYKNSPEEKLFDFSSIKFVGACGLIVFILFLFLNIAFAYDSRSWDLYAKEKAEMRKKVGIRGYEFEKQKHKPTRFFMESF